jgi:hypothetical protein
MLRGSILLSVCSALVLAQTCISDSSSPNALPPACDAFARTWYALSSYSATIAVFEQKPVATDARDNAAMDVTLDYVFRKPAAVRVRVVSGPNTGGDLAWNGGDKVIVSRGSGLFAMFRKTVSLHDAMVTTARGSSIDQLAFGAIIAHLENTPGTLSEGGGEPMNGLSTDAVTLVPTDAALDGGMTREVVEISPATHLPVRILGYEGQSLVRRLDFSNVKVQEDSAGVDREAHPATTLRS